jgi:hypothetical protein
VTPFEALYGRPPPNIRSYVPGSTAVATLDDTLTYHQQVLAVLKMNLTNAQLRMKTQANNGRLDKELEVGSWVWLRLQPYRQHTIRGSHYTKFAKRFFGPYQIQKRIGSVAYELNLHAEARIHPVFHISKLKPFFGTPPSQVPILDESVTGTLVPLHPAQLLGVRKLHTAKGTVLQVLVQWEGLSTAENTWENWKELLESYPNCNLEEKIGPAEGIEKKSTRPNRNKREPVWARDYIGFPKGTK